MQSDTGQVERLLAAIEFSKALVSAYDMETLLTAVLERIKLLLPAAQLVPAAVGPPDPGALFCRDGGGGPGVGQGHPPAAWGKASPAPWPKRASPSSSPTWTRTSAFPPGWIRATGFDTRSIIALPLVVRGEVIGVFEVINVEDEKFFREKYLPHLTILADYVAIAVDNVRNLQKLQARTYIDEVTGFYNTRYLIFSLDHLIPQILETGRGVLHGLPGPG